MKLIDQVADIIGKKPYSIRTEKADVDWIKRNEEGLSQRR
jgi:hypothetical protein